METKIKNNNDSLESILASINALPSDNDVRKEGYADGYEDGKYSFGNLFDIGSASSDYAHFSGASASVTVNTNEKYLQAVDGSGGYQCLLRNTRITNKANTYNLSATFTAVNDGKVASKRFLLRCFDASGNQITSGLSGWTYLAYYSAFYKDTDNVTFTLPSGTATFQIGFMFAVNPSVSGQPVRISNIHIYSPSADVDDAYENGKQAEYDAFWDNYQANGERKDYDYAFTQSTFEYLSPKYPINAKSLYYTFYNCKQLKAIMCDVLPANGIFNNLYVAFAGCSELEEINFDIPAKGVAGMFNSAFTSCVKLKTIKKIIVYGEEYGWSSAFAYCYLLENITFEGDIKTNSSFGFPHSNILSNASVQNIIDHLFDYSGSTARTLQLHADVKARMTDAQKAQITAKNWTLA